MRAWGVAKDAALAASLYDKAAAFGYAPALVALGDRYYSGSGVAPDAEAAYDAYARAAELDGGQGLWNAAVLVEKGVASRAARQSALLQAARAAEAKGSVSALLFLAQVYESGRLGAKADYPLAYSYYTRSAEAGNGYGAWRAALMCHYGRGIPTDYPLAARWYEAARRGAATGRRAGTWPSCCFMAGPAREARSVAGPALAVFRAGPRAARAGAVRPPGWRGALFLNRFLGKIKSGLSAAFLFPVKNC